MMKKSVRLLMMLFAVMASTMSVYATNYWKIRVVAVNPEGGSGQVFTCTWSERSSVTKTWSADYTCGVKSSSGNPDFMLYAQCGTDVEFMGWFKDEACTQSLSSSTEYNCYGSSATFVSMSTSEADAPTTPVYAKFGKVAVDWSTLAEAPTTGNYYLFGVGYNGLAGLYEYSDGKVVCGTKDPNFAVLYTLTFSSATNFTISCVDEGETKYVNKNGTYIKPEASPEKTLEAKGDGTYMVNLNNGHSSGYTWWEMQTSSYSAGKATYSTKNESALSQRWMFVPETAYKNLVSVESLKETGSITIDATPTSSGTTNVKFNVSDIGPVSAFDCTLSGGDGNFELGTPTRSDNVITVPVTYKAQNVHSGTSTPKSTATVTLTAKNEAASSASGLVPAYVNLSPQFALNVTELDWSYNGDDLVETYYAGMEVAASQRARLQNKLIYDPAQTTGVAANFATWTATIIGDDADQFKFANGTQTVSGPYTPDLLDVIFAPTKTSEASVATLHIVTSYMDAMNVTYNCTQDIALYGKSLDVSYIQFAANGNETASDNESYSYGDIIGTNTQTVTAELGIHGVSNLTKVWSDPDGVFEFDVNSIDFSKDHQVLTFNAHRPTPVTTATNHTATLTISGIGSEGPISAVLTLTYRAMPLLTPEVTWNWEHITENTAISNPLTTTSDGAWTLTKLTGDMVTYNAEAKTGTVAYMHHEPATATFAFSILQTDTYAAMNETYTATVSPYPVEIHLTTSAQFNDPNFMSHTSWETFDESKHEMYVDYSDNVDFFLNGHSMMSFSYHDKGTTTWTITEFFSDNSQNVAYNSRTFTEGYNEFSFNPTAVKLRLRGSGSGAYFTDVRFFDTDTITADYDKVVLVNDNGTIHDLAVTATFSNTYSATVALNAAAQPYFELQTAGKASGASIVFDNNDLGLGQVKEKVITITLKEGADAAAAAAATAGNACQVTFGDNYTYNHHEFSMPVILMDAYDVTFKKHAHGTYTVTYADDTEHPQTVSSADFVKHMTSIAPEHTTVTISAPTPAAGYKFQGWKINDQLVSCKASITKMFDEAATIEPVFGIAEGAFKIDAAYFDDLTEALSVAGSLAEQEPVVTLMKDTLLSVPATYTVPAGVTLLIPYKDNYYELETSPEMVIATAETLYAYRTMTLREGVNFICNGNICVGGKIMAAGGGNKSAYVTGGCGVINMVHGGHIEVNDGGNLYCWGFIKGQDMDQGNNTQGTGTVTANNGAKIWENFYLGDWRGGTATSNIYFDREEKMLFPFQSYSIQNIEIPTTYKYGSKLMSTMAVHTGYGDPMFTVATIGSDQALFLLQDEESIVRKWYDPTTDLSCFELNGTALLGSLILNLPFVGEFDSGECNLPISNSMHVMIANCNMTLAKPLTVQAGAVLEIKNTATVDLIAPIHMFDVDEWGLYIHNYYFRSFNILTSHKDRGAENSKAGLDDAKVIIDGTLNVKIGQGAIYATTGGANLMGNGGGVINFEGALPTDNGPLWQVNVLSGSPYITWVENPENAANLHNEDDSYTRSIGYAKFYNINGRWYHEEDKDELEDHTYWFTYMDNGNTGEDVGTNAIYSHDKTGLEAREKWYNVDADENCADWWIGQADGNHYNYTYLNAWHQFMATETPNVYSGSNNKLYAQDECSWSEMGEVDENCLYTFVENEQEVKKALVNGHFIPLESNGYDPAYHAVANAEQYYICFAGCNWHEATPYSGENKAYTIHPEDEDLHYIWFNNDWLNVEREEPFFYTADEVTNVKTYYDYVDGEWVVATPFVRVEDAMETREFYMLKEALNVAQLKKDVTITILRDVHADMTAYTFADLNTNCTLDLNGHVMDLTISGSGTTEVKMFSINMGSGKFTITDNSEYKLGEWRIHAAPTTATQSKRWHGVYVAGGELEINNGKVYVEDMFTYTSTSNSGIVSGVTIAAGKKFTLNDGEIEVKSPYAPYGVHMAASTGTTSLAYINGGTITATSTSTTNTIGLYIGSGTAYVSGGTINANTKTTTARGIYVEGSTSNYIGHLEMTGGTVNATATTTTAYGIYVGGGYTFKNTKPNTIKATFRGVANISGGTVNAVTNGTTTAYSVITLGTTTISGGSFNALPKTTTAYGVLAQDGTVTISGDAVFTVRGTDKVYGVYANGATPTDKTGRPYKPVVTINGGTFNVTIPSGAKNPYGINVDKNTRAITSTASGYYAGNYASEGTVIVNDGVFNVTSPVGTAYDVVVAAAKTETGATGYDAVTAAPKCTINGGMFVATGKKVAQSYPVNASAAAENLVVNGGYFSNNLNLATYAAAPNQVVTLLSKDANYPTYKYKVAEAYTVTFKYDADSVIQTGLQELNEPTLYSNSEPTKANTETNTYIFDGWATEADGDVVYAKGTTLPNVTADATYYAHFNETTKKWRVTWNANGGVCDIEYSYVANNKSISTVLSALPAATRTGYTLAGWYTKASGGSAISTATTIKADKTYYAHWTANKHILTWDLTGGTVTTAGTAAELDATGTPSGEVAFNATITKPVVARAGYKFVSWDATPLAKMPDDDLTYTAQWKANTNTPYQVLHKKQNPANLEEYITVDEDTEDKTGTTATYVTPATKTYVGYVTPATQTVQIAADGSLVVEYLYDLIGYTITFDANGGTCGTASADVKHGATLTLPIATREGVGNISYEFAGWFTKAVGGDQITASTIIQRNIGTLYAHWTEIEEAMPDIIAENGESITIDDDYITTQGTNEVTNLIIENGGTVTVTANIVVDNLYLEGTDNTSGQLMAAPNKVTATNAYYDYAFNETVRHWRAFGVPWMVNLDANPLKEVKNQAGETVNRTLVLGSDYDIVYYNGAKRAAQGAGTHCWEWVKNGSHMLQPGKCYMIAFNSNVGTLRFAKAYGAPVVFNGTMNVAANTGDADNGGWNAIANPMTYHATMDAGPTTAQVHNGGLIGEDDYIVYNIEDKKFVVGKAVYVQVDAAQSVVIENAGSKGVITPAAAPKRNAQRVTDKRYLSLDDYYTVAIQGANETSAAKVYVLPEEDKADEYVIGHDLAKMGMSASRSQIWVKEYGVNLCMHTAAPFDGVTEIPVKLYAPVAGEYSITNVQSPITNEDYTVYLTRDGEAIWNLSNSPYLMTLSSGTNSNYGLRISAKVPQVTTGIDEAIIDAQGETRKVLINDKVYIIRGDKAYSIDGQTAK